ncbi:MAG: hypothetical protein AB1443_07195 [Pseudomonadota bacterium]
MIKFLAIGAIVNQIAAEFEAFFEVMFPTCCFNALVAFLFPALPGRVMLLPINQRIPLKS